MSRADPSLLFFVATIEQRQGLKIACVEEIAYRMGYIDKDGLFGPAKQTQNNEYGKYLLQLTKEWGKIKG